LGLFCSLGPIVEPLSAGREAKAKGKPAVLVVLVPEEDAVLTVSGAKTMQKGKKRRFASPALVPGKQYTYKLKVTWEPNNYTAITRIKDVVVEAGKTTTVDLNKPNPKRPDDIVVRFVPTPGDVVEAMCKLGGVTKNDVVYDIGCGDGVMIITAVKKFGAKKGVGIDLDPERVKDTIENAKKAGVGDKIVARQGDMLKLKPSDIADADVILLYIGDDLGARLAPVLKKLKPGTRIVSHYFKLGDWAPTKTENYKGVDDVEYPLHLWKVEEKKKVEDE
jgi:uncharacterized protein (TIGR03000 family)